MSKYFSVARRWLFAAAASGAALTTATPALAITAAEVPQLAYFSTINGISSNPEFRFYRNGRGQITNFRSTAAGYRNVDNTRWSITRAGNVRVELIRRLPVEGTIVETDPVTGTPVEVRVIEELRSIDLEYLGGGTPSREPVRYIQNFRTSFPDNPERAPETNSQLLFGNLVSGDGFGLFTASELISKRVTMNLTDPARTSCDGSAIGCARIGQTYDVFSFRADFSGRTGRTGRGFTWSLKEADHRLDLVFENGDRASYHRIASLGTDAYEVVGRIVALDGTEFADSDPSSVVTGTPLFNVQTVPGYYNQNGIGDEDNGFGDFVLYYAPDGIAHQISRLYDETGTLQSSDSAVRRWRVVDGVIISERTLNFTTGQSMCDVSVDPECVVVDRRTQRLVRREVGRYFIEESRAIFYDIGGVDVNVPVPQYLSRFYDRTDTLPPPPAPPVELLKESSRALSLR